MDVNKFMGGSWLKATDLEEGKRYNLMIESVSEYDAIDKKSGNRLHWPVLHFKGKETALGLGTKANLRMCVHNFGGTETDDWIGRRLVIFRTVTDYQGRITPCIRIVPKEELGKGDAPVDEDAPMDEGPDPAEFSDDDIPF